MKCCSLSGAGPSQDYEKFVSRAVLARHKGAFFMADEPTVIPLTVATPGAAALIGICSKTWRSLDASGQVPMPLLLGRSRRWGVQDLENWVAAGGPSRQVWAKERKA